MEELVHDVCADVSDTVQLEKLFLRHFCDGIQIRICRRQCLTDVLADTGHAQALDDTRERRTLRFLDIRQHRLDGLLPYAFQLCQFLILILERIQVQRLLNQACVNELIDHGRSKTDDVHDRLTAVEFNPSGPLCGTHEIRASDNAGTYTILICKLNSFAAADRALLDFENSFSRMRNGDDLRNDFAALNDCDRGPNADMHLLDESLIMERRSGYHRSRQRDRVEYSNGCQNTCAADLYDDFTDDSICFIRFILICRGVLGVLCSHAKLCLTRTVIRLDDGTVNPIRERIPDLSNLIDCRHHLIDVLAFIRLDGVESQLFQQLQILRFADHRLRKNGFVNVIPSSCLNDSKGESL